MKAADVTHTHVVKESDHVCCHEVTCRLLCRLKQPVRSILLTVTEALPGSADQQDFQPQQSIGQTG